jgi:hypothetical protein
MGAPSADIAPSTVELAFVVVGPVALILPAPATARTVALRRRAVFCFQRGFRVTKLWRREFDLR